MTEEEKQAVLEAVQIASEKWKNAFNSGNAAGCAAAYEENAIMNAKPFGTFKGRFEVQAFWEKLIADGFSDVEYIEPELEVRDASSAVLKSGWRMNNAHGVITNELWVIQNDGTALLREDDFEAQG
ncbi:hypothetical protein [Kordiimonas laminariae]|uniref:hypothetical protein n=1 Tax=Kordiimonas laminariae TaxID=2917717 RepID=UPI001FF6069E|nr:hypothetical protein [Kordiimonas laminariae]MCK0070574.1 hypothetical protein [Kordiimonas laminariae]